MAMTMNSNDLKNVALYASIGALSTFIFTKLLGKKEEEEELEEVPLLSPNSTDGVTPSKLKSNSCMKSNSLISAYFLSKIPPEIKNSTNTLLDELKYLGGAICTINKVDHLIWDLGLAKFPSILSPLLAKTRLREIYGGGGFIPDDSFIYVNSYVIYPASFGPNSLIEDAKRWLRAGPRKHIFFEPSEVKVAICTCGGLCPGLNVVIREIVTGLKGYGVNEFYGIQFGYRGFYSYDWIPLTIDKVKDIHHYGGTILGSSRGGFDGEKIINSLLEKGINQLFIVGGDGTHKGIMALYKIIKERNLKISIVGLPKTIDNDIPIIDKSFGFETAVAEAVKAIKSAYVESHCAEYGVGLVRLMGRDSGFIAANASSASRDVNICLVPEFKFELNGKYGVLEYTYQRLLTRRHCVIVVAEGAGEAMCDASVAHIGTDNVGHIKYGDIGLLLKDKIVDYCKEKGMEVTLKYVDPTYMIRSVPANAHDQKMCSQLAQNAAHGAMAGFTGFSVGHISNRTAYIPVKEIVSSKRRLHWTERAWQRLISGTGQPMFRNPDLLKEEKAEKTAFASCDSPNDMFSILTILSASTSAVNVLDYQKRKLS